MKTLTKNNLIILGTIFFAISAFSSSMTLSSSIENSELIQNRIWYFSSLNEEMNTEDVLTALNIINSDIEPMLNTVRKSISNNQEDWKKSMQEFDENIKLLNKEMSKYDKISLVTFWIGLLISILAIIMNKRE